MSRHGGGCAKVDGGALRARERVRMEGRRDHRRADRLGADVGVEREGGAYPQALPPALHRLPAAAVRVDQHPASLRRHSADREDRGQCGNGEHGQDRHARISVQGTRPDRPPRRISEPDAPEPGGGVQDAGRVSDQPALGDSYFLSYSRDDESIAMRFAHDLRERGIAMWVDQLDIRPSERWDRAIERAVRDCRGLVVILSPRSVASDNVADEISFAIDHGKSVLPVMIERCALPLRITRMQVIDATGDYDRALQLCVDAVSSGNRG